MVSPSDDFGDLDTPFEDTVTNAQLADELLQYICPAGEPWTGDDPTSDHGHTQCMWIGLASRRLREVGDD